MRAMPTKVDVPELRISSYMSLEQAMAEVRTYLEARKNRRGIEEDFGNVGAGQLSMQGTLVERLGEISNRLGEVEPNSKLGPPGVFLKRILKKLIGWHAKPAHEFDRTAVEAFRQIRHDMLQLQHDMAALSRKIDEEQKPYSAGGRIAGSERGSQTNGGELARSMLLLFRSLIDTPAIQSALRSEKPELLQRVESLMALAEAEFRSQTQKTGSPAL